MFLRSHHIRKNICEGLSCWRHLTINFTIIISYLCLINTYETFSMKRQPFLILCQVFRASRQMWFAYLFFNVGAQVFLTCCLPILCWFCIRLLLVPISICQWPSCYWYTYYFWFIYDLQVYYFWFTIWIVISLVCWWVNLRVFL